MRSDFRKKQPVLSVDENDEPIPPPARENDNRTVVVQFPADTGSYLWMVGRGDDLNPSSGTGRGMGQKIAFEFTEPGEKSIELEFKEQVQVHDGRLFVDDPSQWDIITDEWHFCIFIPATEVTPNATGEGNCHVVNEAGEPWLSGGQPDAQQGYYVIVPAAGDGTYDVDLDTARPVPKSGGFWDFDYRTNELTVSPTPGQAGIHLLTVQPPKQWFQRSMPVPAHPHGVFDFDAYKAERIWPRWKMKLIINKVSAGPGKMAGWLVFFREIIE